QAWPGLLRPGPLLVKRSADLAGDGPCAVTGKPQSSAIDGLVLVLRPEQAEFGEYALVVRVSEVEVEPAIECRGLGSHDRDGSRHACFCGPGPVHGPDLCPERRQARSRTERNAHGHAFGPGAHETEARERRRRGERKEGG